MKDNFEHILKQLNTQQRKAVEQIDGPVMVIAGPGTGKTHVLAARIAQILQTTDTPPYSILALTFTESAAINMRERVVRMIGKAGYYVNISTFHAFCADVMKSNPEYFPIQRGSEPLGELERYQIFESIIREAPIDKLKPLNREMFYLPDIISAISNLKREGVNVDQFNEIVKEEYVDHGDVKLTKAEKLKQENNKIKNEELSVIYKMYQDKLHGDFRYDFDDMIAFVVDAFQKNELLLRDYQERLLYFLVDEYQDTNSAQNNVINLLASYWGEKANIFVVGDPHQSIYRFQGASIENSLRFVDTYTHAQVITLDKGYRCPQNIYDVAYEVIQNNTLTKEVSGIGLSNTRLESGKTTKDANLLVGALPSQILEHVFVADTIQKLMSKGEHPEDIAVLYRNNVEAEALQESLEAYGVPYEIDGGGNILQNEHVQQLLQYLRLVNSIKNGAESDNLFQVMLYEWTAVDPGLTLKLGRVAGKSKMSIYELIKKGYEHFNELYALDDVTPIDFLQAESFVETLEQALISDSHTIFTEWFENIITTSGYMAWIHNQKNKIQLLMNLNSLYQEIKSLVGKNHNIRLASVVDAFEVMKEHNISILAEDLNVKKGAVHLSTVHRAKGREWKYVFLTGFIDGRWGNSRRKDLIPLPSLLQKTDLSKKERNEDDRRLFYVALTRAQESFYITYPESIISESRSKDVINSMFIEEIPADKIQHVNKEEVAQKAVDELERLLVPQASPEVYIKEKAFFEHLVKDFKLSVTALNTYLKDTDEFVHNVLLKVPRAKPAPMAFGTAVHYALEQLYKGKMEGTAIDEEVLLTAFAEALAKEPLTSAEFDRRLAYGKKILTQYFKEYKAVDIKPLFIERFFGYGFSKTILDDIQLVGRIDRIDWIDQKNRTVRVVDYKTGRSKSMNDIEGKTKSANLSERELGLPESIRGPYKRQLVFYKLLSELDQTFVPEVQDAVFDFVEPDKQTGKFTQRTFSITEEEVTLLKDLIKEVMGEIRELKFLK